MEGADGDDEEGQEEEVKFDAGVISHTHTHTCLCLVWLWGSPVPQIVTVGLGP